MAENSATQARESAITATDRMILAEVADPEGTQRGVAALYAIRILQTPTRADYGAINKAIATRWDIGATKEIAWKLVDAAFPEEERAEVRT